MRKYLNNKIKEDRENNKYIKQLKDAKKMGLLTRVYTVNGYELWKKLKIA